MYVCVKESGCCATVSQLPSDAFFVVTFDLSNNQKLSLYLSSEQTPVLPKCKHVHQRMYPNPLCYGLLWGTMYFSLMDDCNTIKPLTKDLFVKSIGAMKPTDRVKMHMTDLLHPIDEEVNELRSKYELDSTLTATEMAEEVDYDMDDDDMYGVGCDECSGGGCSICNLELETDNDDVEEETDAHDLDDLDCE